MIEAMQAVTPSQLVEWRKQGVVHQLIDVREDYEVETCSIGGVHIPMGEIGQRLDEVERNIPVVIHCKSGRRSEAVAAHLQRLGFNNVHTLDGGIMAWIETIDSNLETY
jgi:rhodanese-related sulfurtransferase